MPQGFIDISVTGDKELQRLLDDLEKRDARRIVKAATKDGAKYLHQQVLRAIPVHSGVLLALMSRFAKTVVSIKKNRRGFFGYAIQTPPRSDFPADHPGVQKSSEYYPAHLEYGRKDGSVAPHPYIRNTTEEARQPVLAILAQSIRRRINALARKRTRRTAA